MNRSAFCVAAFSALLSVAPGFARPGRAAIRPVHMFSALALAPDGTHIASIEHDDPADEAEDAVERLFVRASDGANPVEIKLPCAAVAACRPSDLAFSRDGKRLAFILHKPSDDHSYIEQVGIDGRSLVESLAFEGNLGHPAFGADGTLAVLAIPGAHKEAGAIKPRAPMTGEIGVTTDEQRIGVLTNGALHYVSPPDLYVYEYDWRPDGSGFVGTAAPGNGDDHWWIAKLWSFPRAGTPRVLFDPPADEQLADPVVSPDGQEIAFIGGIMSDFGSTGGDAFELATRGEARPIDMTPDIKASVTALSWGCGSRAKAGALRATALRADQTELLALDAPGAAPHVLWSRAEGLSVGGWTVAAACAGDMNATIAEDFDTPPEIVAGTLSSLRPVTHVNEGITAGVIARSLTWKSDGFDVQGWLLQPRAHAAEDDQRLITEVHGGPGAASTPHFLTRHDDLFLLNAGYDVFLPNPRGSFGQGEAFTHANVRDFGHGDLRDVLRGVDAAIAAAPIDPAALGLTGYSYGGYMTMWAVTQTDRFKAAVAGAGISDWLSYTGENGIDAWLIPYFGASVYDDRKVYDRSSPIDYVRHVHTPTFVYVGDRDLECPMPQSQEFWHALRSEGVPTAFVVYPGQGHELRDPADEQDAERRTVAWFDRWLKPPARKQTITGSE